MYIKKSWLLSIIKKKKNVIGFKTHFCTDGDETAIMCTTHRQTKLVITIGRYINKRFYRHI